VKQINNALIIIETVLAVLLMAGVLIQTPKASGLGWRVSHPPGAGAAGLLDDLGAGRGFPGLLDRAHLDTGP
jgi:preprotein translocase subunit SecG